MGVGFGKKYKYQQFWQKRLAKFENQIRSSNHFLKIADSHLSKRCQILKNLLDFHSDPKRKCLFSFMVWA